MSAKVLAFAGSARKDSFNKQLVRNAAAGATAAGAEVTLIDLADYPLPIFDEDLEAAGTPENALKLKALFLQHDALLIASPEYNSSVSPMLKNVIDWVSRPASGEAGLAAYQNKTAAILAASPGGLGGLRGLVHLRSILSNIGVTVIPGQLAVPRAFEVLASGEIADPKMLEKVQAVGAELARVASLLKQ